MEYFSRITGIQHKKSGTVLTNQFSRSFWGVKLAKVNYRNTSRCDIVNNKDTRMMSLACIFHTQSSVSFIEFEHVNNCYKQKRTRFRTLSNIFDAVFLQKITIFTKQFPLSSVFVFGVILDRIFPHSDQLRRDTEHLSVLSPHMVKYGPE